MSCDGDQMERLRDRVNNYEIGIERQMVCEENSFRDLKGIDALDHTFFSLDL